MSDNSIFKLDQKFTEQLHTRLLQLDKQYFGDSPLQLSVSKSIPTIAQIEEIILTLFSASIQPEEGHCPKLS
jgi:hypothetical protein